ncbi:plastocyanin/azurin family copper-binding protein [Halopiger djelfimassiliensis]|uniref:plastocyanin/azurin family copper-binding protein n=1 Tax=Halopiger djelfimassiliensis TaxID=1293047 RepID=UPI000677B322|nr:plastocyanin/azurin family copper-binding protein [Halopiger djelfimassiliensis]
MARENPISRRTALKVTGAAASTAFIAGCSSDDGGDDDDGSSDDGGDEVYEISSDEDVVFRADGTSWYGKSPSKIEDVENPTLGLTKGETYTMGWDEGNGGRHNFEICDSDDEVIGDYSTDQTAEPEGDDQMLDVEITDEVAEYVCRPHATSGMRGDIEVQSDE